MTDTPEIITGLRVDGAGLADATGHLTEHLGLWDRIGASVGRVDGLFGGISSKLLGLAGISGIGAFVNQVIKLEEHALGASLAINSITGGPGGYSGLAISAASLQARTGVAASSSLAALSTYAQQTGTTPGFGVVPGINRFAQAYGISPEAAAQIAGGSYQASGGGMGPGATLNLYAQQAARYGMEQQSAVLASGAVGLQGIGAASGQMPGGSAVTKQLFTSAFLDALAAHDKTFAGVTGVQTATSAFSGIQSGIQGGVFNPSMMAFMRQAGISPKDALQGLTGPNGAGTLQKLVARANSEFGAGSTLEDMFFFSQFGPTAAKALMDFASGKGTLADVMKGLNAATLPASHAGQRAAQAQSTPGSALSQAQGVGLTAGAKAAQGALNSPLGALGVAAGGYGALKAGKYILKRAWRGLRAGTPVVGEEGAAAAAEGAAISVGGVVAGGVGGAIALTLDSLIDPGGSSDLIGALTGGGLAVPQMGGAGEQHQNAVAVQDVMRAAKSKFGAKWTTSTGQAWMRQQLNDPRSRYNQETRVHSGGDISSPHPYAATQLLDSIFTQAGQQAASPTSNPKIVDKFAKAVDKFAQLVSTPGFKSASYMGAGQTMMNASFAGPASVNAVGQTAPGMLYAAFLGGGMAGGATTAGGVPGIVNASYVTPSSSTPSTGAGWSSCTLTWYDPALGGINGGGTYADGGTYRASDMACAAPPAYSFGTMIEFSYKGQSVTCEVRDRGGAIQGSHFDLTRGAAGALGMLSAGNVQGKFRVKGTSSSASKKKTTSSASGSGSTQQQRLQAALANPRVQTASYNGGSAGSGGTPHVTVNIDGRTTGQYNRITRT